MAMAMTKKHFTEMAEKLKSVKPEREGADYEAKAFQWMRAVRAMAFFCARQNKSFDYTRFYSACGMED